MTVDPSINTKFHKDLASVLNRYSAENGSDTPDHILANFLLNCLSAFDTAVMARSTWYGRHDEPGKSRDHHDEATIRTIVDDWMKHLGYTEAEIALVNEPVQHSDNCEFVPGVGWQCIDENGDDQHPEHTEAYQVAELVMFITSHPTLKLICERLLST